MMNLGNLAKEQKQYLGIGLIVAVVVLVLGVMGIRFSLSSIADAKVELEELSKKITMADGALEKRDVVEGDFRRTMATLKQHLDHIPPAKNYYSWATEIIYASGRNAQLEIDSVDEIRAAAPKKKSGKKPSIQLESYSLRVVGKGNYEQVKTFLSYIETQYPLARFTGVEINVGQDEDTHSIQMFVEWPRYPEQIERVWEDVAASQSKLLKRQPDYEREPAPAVVQSKDTKPEAVVEPSIPEVARDPAPVKAVHVPAVIEPEPIVAAKVPETVVEPEQPVEKAKPAYQFIKPVPAQVVASADSAPVVEPMERSMTDAAPVEPKQEPAPVVVAELPVPVQKPIPVEEPAPVAEPFAAVVEPKPIPAPVVEEPVPVIADIEKPDPVVAAVPEKKDTVGQDSSSDSLNSILASLSEYEEESASTVTEAADSVETTQEPSAASAIDPDDELGSLLATLNSGDDKAPEATEEIKPDVIPEQPVSESREDLESLLASAEIEPMEEPQVAAINDVVVEPKVEPITEPQVEPATEPKDDLGSLLASLGNRGTEPAEEQSPESSLQTASSSDPAELEAFLRKLEEEQAVEEKQPVEQPEPVVVKTEEPVAPEYVSNGKSAIILAGLLSKDKPKEVGSLSSFLDNMVENIND